MKQQTVLEKRCRQIVIPPMSESDSSVERACRRQMLIDQLMGDAPTLPPRPDDLRPARIAKIVGIIRSNLEAQNRHDAKHGANLGGESPLLAVEVGRASLGKGVLR